MRSTTNVWEQLFRPADRTEKGGAHKPRCTRCHAARAHGAQRSPSPRHASRLRCPRRARSAARTCSCLSTRIASRWCLLLETKMASSGCMRRANLRHHHRLRRLCHHHLRPHQHRTTASTLQRGFLTLVALGVPNIGVGQTSWQPMCAAHLGQFVGHDVSAAMGEGEAQVAAMLLSTRVTAAEACPVPGLVWALSKLQRRQAEGR